MEQQFFTELAEQLEVDAVMPDDILADFAEWDSLTVLGIVAMIDGRYGVNVFARELAAIATAGELAQLVDAKRRMISNQ